MDAGHELVGFEQIGLARGRRAAHDGARGHRRFVEEDDRHAGAELGVMGVADAQARYVGDEIAESGSCASKRQKAAVHKLARAARLAFLAARTRLEGVMLSLSLPAAALGGLISFLSPCVLPLVPPYLSYLAGHDLRSAQCGRGGRCAAGRFWPPSCSLRASPRSSCFWARRPRRSGRSIRQYLDVLSTLAGVAIIVMGLHFLGVFRIGLFYREARVHGEKPVGLWGAYVMGLAFAFGWTPCIGPVLAADPGGRRAPKTASPKARMLLAAYSAGLGIPFLLAAFAMRPFMALDEADALAFRRDREDHGRAARPHRHRVPDRLDHHRVVLASGDVSRL